MSRRIASTVLMLLVACLLCVPKSALVAQTFGTGLEPPLTIGTTDFVELSLDPAETYDYFGWCILQQISGTLVSVEPGTTTGADYVPELAESWNASSDLTTWDFTLRQGVNFSGGTEFNATHVKYSFDRAIALIPTIPEGAPNGLGFGDMFNHTEVLSKYKVRFVLNFPFSPFLSILSCRASAIVDPTYAPMDPVNYTQGDARASTPVAFVEPYVLTEWERVSGKDIGIVLSVNPNYWNKNSGYPRANITFKFYNSSSALRSAFEAGEVDIAFRHFSQTDMLDLDQNQNAKVWRGTGDFIQYLCFQEKRAPFNDSRARVAVTAALNRSSVCQTVFQGLSEPLYSIIPPGMLGHTEAFKKLGDANYTYTRSLLAEAGYNESRKLTFDLWYESSGHYPMSAEQALLYKEALEGSGVITVTLRSADWASYKYNRDSEIMDAYAYGWYPDYVDPDDYSFLYWATWLHTNYYNATYNPHHATYLEQVAKYEEARTTTNLTRRAELYAQIDDRAVQECSIVPLYISSTCAVTKPNVNGIYLDITQDMRYWLIGLGAQTFVFPVAVQGHEFQTTIVTNSTVDSQKFTFSEEDMEIRFNVTGPSGSNGFCNITIPRAMLDCTDLDQWAITVNGTNVGGGCNRSRDENFTYITIPYSHSAQSIAVKGTWVVPELRPITILSMLMVTTLLTTLICKRKRLCSRWEIKGIRNFWQDRTNCYPSLHCLHGGMNRPDELVVRSLRVGTR